MTNNGDWNYNKRYKSIKDIPKKASETLEYMRHLCRLIDVLRMGQQLAVEWAHPTIKCGEDGCGDIYNMSDWVEVKLCPELVDKAPVHMCSGLYAARDLPVGKYMAYYGAAITRQTTIDNALSASHHFIQLYNDEDYTSCGEQEDGSSGDDDNSDHQDEEQAGDNEEEQGQVLGRDASPVLNPINGVALRGACQPAMINRVYHIIQLLFILML